MSEYTFTSETAARTSRRAMINRGASVSLLSFDGSRDLYVFDSDAAPYDHTSDALTSGEFVFGKADGTVVHRAADIDHASAWAVDNLEMTGSGIAVFTPTGGSIPAGHFLLLARKMIRLRGNVTA